MNGSLTQSEARNLSALKLAFIGDAVYNLHSRMASLKAGQGLRDMHLGATRRVNAAAQAQALKRLEGALSEDELDIVRRGRNAHPRHQAPRSATSAQYSASTALEALIGYLYLTGQHARLHELLDMLHENAPNDQNPTSKTLI